MKKSYSSFIKIFSCLALLLVGNACDKSIESSQSEPFLVTTLDATGGNWKTILLANSNELTVATPKSTNSIEYQAEISDLKQIQSQATEEQKNTARYWGAGAVLRWNEVAREMAAQYNIPPKYNADGTYPAPDANNPTAFPRFPFANPPYAARVFALLSVAQYDAMVTTWNYKFKYNRTAPSKTDANIKTLLPVSDLPAYPSEDAVVAAASREVLKFLFPGEIASLTSKAEEHKNSRLWAGMNVKSDIDAGEELGKLVAAKVIAYARTDNMGKANTQADYPKLKEDATKRGLTALWTSQDIPVRPPMLPFYGNVKNWNFDAATRVALRPAAPPLPGTAEFEKDVAELRDMAKNRTREQFRIASFWADGAGTYTPPGHWNRKAAELTFANKFNELRTARTFALVNTAIMDAGVCCWETKYYYLTQRPSEVDKSIKTSTGIPNFPGYTSGHSTFSGAAAEVLSYIFPDEKNDLEAMAKEASESRIYGAIHFRIDCEVGLRCGKQIGAYAVSRGKNDGSGL
ncbi:MAG: phosphatase PAP2 family protein [Verrucomicrobia bacterium]|nr:phosphatase PAP2 family protein [Cytophagales bacterium]